MIWSEVLGTVLGVLLVLGVYALLLRFVESDGRRLIILLILAGLAAVALWMVKQFEAAVALAMAFPPLVPHNQDDFDDDWRRAERRARRGKVLAVIGGMLVAGALIWLASRFLT